MMKKKYQIPETYIFEKMVVASLLAASVKPESDSERQVDGNPTTESNLPGDATNTTDTENGSSLNNGQGTGGSGNRAKMWDDTWDLPQWWNF